MEHHSRSNEELLRENEELRTRLEEAEDALRAIRSGEVDALVIYGEEGERVFTLQGADHPYRVMVESIHEGAATLQADATILYCNQRMADFLSIPLQHLLGDSLLDYISHNDREAFQTLIQNGLTESRRAEFAMQCGDGTSKPALISVSPVEIDRARGVCLVATDLTEQKRSEQILAEERMSRSILEQANEVIVVCDVTGIIIRASQIAHELLPQSPLFRPFQEAFPIRIPEGDNGKGYFSISKILSGNSYRGIEAELQLPDEPVQYVLLSGTPLQSDGEILGCVVNITDITKHKQAEVALNDYAGRLVRSNKELEQFAFVASHDLQEPLRKITRFGDILVNRIGDKLEDQPRDFLMRMQDAAKRMESMINDLLELSRVGTHFSKAVPIDLTKMALEIVSDLDMRIRSTKGKVMVEELPVVEADPTQMRQLLQNLIGNAVKYHKPDTPPVVKISGKLNQRIPGIAPNLTIFVEDNGIGFSEEYTDHIFLPFTRMHGRSEYEGTGIGLAICKKIVERHHGTITARSKPGEGSTFVVTLPVKQSSNPE